MRLCSLSLVLSLLLAGCVVSCQKQPPLSPASLFAGTQFEEIATIEGFSEPVQVFISARFVGGIARPGEQFRISDTIDSSRPRLPPRRLIQGGRAKHLEYIWYDAGGIGRHQHFVLFRTTNETAEPILVTRGLYCESLSELKDLLSSGKFEDETGNPYEW
jgi:hypothetical protein